MPDNESRHDLGAEYRAARHGAALFNRSALGKVSVTGRDRLAFLQGMLTNDVKGLQPGQGAPAAFLDAHELGMFSFGLAEALMSRSIIGHMA